MLRWRFIPTVSALVFVTTSLTACNDVVDEEVPLEVCVSGKRWIGGDRGSPNMYPGRDCVGCHEDNDAPELILGGTIYDVQDKTYVQSEDCFGSEGVKITITGGDGQVFETQTNEAGNFWFAARDVDIVMPYSARFEYPNKQLGTVDEAPMFRNPYYGGCARCHGPNAVPTDPALGEQFPAFVPPNAAGPNAVGRIGSASTGGIEGFIEWVRAGKPAPAAN